MAATRTKAPWGARLAELARELRGRLVPAARERGFLLVGLVTTITVSSILASAMVQEWSVILKREREADLIFIQEQYAAAILRFQEANNALPTELDQLNDVHGTKGLFLRHPYTDPLYPGSELEDWCLLKLNAAGRAISSCSAEGDPSNFGLGSNFSIGEERSAPQNRPGQAGIAAGQGIIGVHSKSTDTAYNILKRQEKTYNRWYYTAEDYRKEMTGRSIPGLEGSGGTGPGIGNQQNQSGQSQRGGSNQTGRQGRSNRRN